MDREGLWKSLPPPPLLPTPRPWLTWTICQDRSWIFCLGHHSQSWGLERPGAVGCPIPLPITFGGSRAWWHLCNNVCVSLPPATGTGECTLFWGVSGGRPNPPFSLPLMHARSRDAPSLSGVTGTYVRTGPLSPTYLPSSTVQRKSDGGMLVVAGGQCQPPPGDPMLETLRIRLVLPRVSTGPAGVYPQLFPPPEPGVAQGTRSLEFRTQHKHKHGHKLALATATHGPPFVLHAGIFTPLPLPQPLLFIQTPVRVPPPFLSAGGPWASEQPALGTRWRTQSMSGFPGGSRLILFLVSLPPGLISLLFPVHIRVYLLSPCHRFFLSHRDASCIRGISPIINKTYIYTVCNV